MEEEKQQKKLVRRLKNKYRLVLMNDTSFEEKLSFKLSLLNILTLAGITIILLIIILTSLIVLTPLREYIPGYADEVATRKSLDNLTLKADSLNQALEQKTAYINNIKLILSGKIGQSDSTRASRNKVAANVPEMKKLNTSPSKDDSILRHQIESNGKYNLSLNQKNPPPSSISSYFFFTPLKGIVTNPFNVSTGHYGVDIVAKENEAIKATLDGTVIFAGWTSATGYTIAIQHANNLISVYKHNAVLLKKEGDNVKAGEVIAIIGNSGELTTGPHLHFELWYNGIPINPTDYMVF